MKANKSIIFLAVAALVLLSGLGSLSYISYQKDIREFVADGYILKPSEEVNVTTDVNEQIYFSQGTKYKEKYKTKVLFKDIDGKDVSLDTEEFVHYADGSLGAFTKGVIMDVSELEDEQYGYYNLSKKTILAKNGSSYEIQSRGQAMNLTEFIWKISDNDYMLVAPSVTLNLSENVSVTLEDYAQIKYVDNGIVRIVHRQGTYQTIANDTFLVTESGAELNLVGKSFFIDGEPAVSLSKMSMDDNSYIELDENDDTPEIKIPTFQVINGKDGAAGANGESGEKGKIGEDGEEGEAGEDGESGDDGATGGEGYLGEDGSTGARGGKGDGGEAGMYGEDGARGSTGSGGVEGDTGDDGYDGKKGGIGTNGKDAESKAEISAIATANVMVRPMITMQSDSYKVAPGSFQMQLNFSDSDSSLEAGSLEVKIYDRETMQEIDSSRMNSFGAELESYSNTTINATGLMPDHDYIVIVSGKYFAEEEDMGADASMEANLFTKVIRTPSLGLKLEKVLATQNSITLKVTKTLESISSYGVMIYEKDADGNKINERVYSSQTSSRDDFEFGNGKPNASDISLKTNTKYYASLCNLSTSNGIVSTDGKELEIYTLKTKPYYDDGYPIESEEHRPLLTADYRSHVVNLEGSGTIYDPNMGIETYRYELYRLSDYYAAISGISPNFDKLVPIQTYDSKSFDKISFEIDPYDNTSYIGRIVCIYNDNEKVVELPTAFSGAEALSGLKFPEATFTFTNASSDPSNGHMISSQHDTLTGTVNVSDTNGIVMVNADRKFMLKFANDYGDVNIVQTEGNQLGRRFDIPFDVSGLRSGANYTVSLYGPVDTDNDGAISDVEKLTYIGSTVVATTEPLGLRASFKKVNMAGYAFAIQVNISQAPVVASNNQSYQYVANTLDEISFVLEHHATTGTITQLGEIYNVKDAGINANLENYEDLNHSSIFGETSEAYIADSDASVSVLPANGTYNIVDGYYTAGDVSSNEKLILTPVNFDLDANYGVLYSGGSFIIRIVSAKDYTKNTTNGVVAPNEIKFITAEADTVNHKNGDRCEFTLEKRHVQALDPNNAVTVTKITNGNAPRDHKVAGYSDSAVVGLRMVANYAYSDAMKITYDIYRIGDDESKPTYTVADPTPTDPSNTKTVERNIYPAGYNPAQLEMVDAVGGVTNLGTKVLSCTIDGLGGDTGNGVINPIEVYFRDADGDGKIDSSSGITWTNCTSETDLSKIIERGHLYYITYEVTSSHTVIDCGPDGGAADGIDDIYPYCAYGGAAADRIIPFYRSQTISINNQAPVIQRYQASNDTNSVTWKYKISDPDNALVKDAAGKVIFNKRQVTADEGSAAYEALKDEETAAVSQSVTITDGSWSTVKITGIDKKYYTIGLQYKLTNRASSTNVKEIISGINEFTKSVSAAEALGTINVKRRSTDGSVNAITCEGGYRYRITLSGNKLDEAVALRVEFNGISKSDGTPKTVVVDPVYFDAAAMTDSSGGQFRVAYIDATRVDELSGNVATVKVSAYYDTHVRGLNYDNLKMQAYSGNGSLEPNKAYALVSLDNSRYYYWNSNQNKLVQTLMLQQKSLFTPYAETVDGHAFNQSNKLNLSYFNQPKNAGTDAEKQINLPIVIDDFGVKSSSFSDAYISLDELGVLEVPYGVGESNSIAIVESQPAISLNTQMTSSGVQSLTYQFRVYSGSGDATGLSLYAKIKEYDSTTSSYVLKPLVLKHETRTNGGVTEDYYYYEMQSGTAADSYYDYANFADPALGREQNNSVKVQADGRSLSVPVRGLKKDTAYILEIFTYDNLSNQLIELYSTDYQNIGYWYELRTKDLVSIDLKPDSVIYYDYLTKHARFLLRVNEDDASGMKVYYSIEDLETNTLVLTDVLWQRIGEGSIANPYYVNTFENNRPADVRMWPDDSGVLKFNHSYKMTAVVKNEGGTEVLGNGSLSFRTPDVSTLEESNPTTTMNLIEIKNAGNPALKVEFTCRDTYRSIISNSSTNTGITIKLIDAATNTVVSTHYDYIRSEYYPYTCTFNDLVIGKKYKVEASFELDMDNDKVPDSTVTKTKEYTLNEATGADKSFDVSDQSLKLILMDLKNFSDVNQVSVTVYYEDPTRGPQQVFSQDETLAPGQNKYTFTWESQWFDNTLRKTGSYYVEVHYNDYDSSTGVATKLGEESARFSYTKRD